jgi:hypothetical protein
MRRASRDDCHRSSNRSLSGWFCAHRGGQWRQSYPDFRTVQSPFLAALVGDPAFVFIREPTVAVLDTHERDPYGDRWDAKERA